MYFSRHNGFLTLSMITGLHTKTISFFNDCFSPGYQECIFIYNEICLPMNYLLHKDEGLLHLLNQSDAQAFNEIYRRYWAVVFRYAVCKVHTPAIAEDLCQDIFVSLWQRRATLSIQNLEAYLIQATKYGVLNYIRLQVQERKRSAAAAVQKNTENETENTAALRTLMQAWEKAVSELPVKTGEVFRLSNIDDYSNKEIAAKLQLSEKAVEYHITKSYKILRLQLQDFTVLLLALLFIQ